MFHNFFMWFYANVFGNLVASAICFGLTWIVGFRRLHKQKERHHQEQMAWLKHIAGKVDG